MSLLHRVLNKLKGTSGPPNVKENIRLIKEGAIKAGNECNLNGMNVIIADRKPGHVYIEMGDNCCICGTIILYKPLCKVIIGNDVYIGPGTYLECTETITVGNNVLISMHCNIIDTNSHSIHSKERMNDSIDWQKGHAFKNWKDVDSASVEISDKCWIGMRSIVLKGVKIGEGSIVGAGSVVTKPVKAFSLVGGNPAVFIKQVD